MTDLKLPLLPCPFCGGPGAMYKGSHLDPKLRYAACADFDCPGYRAEQDEQGGVNAGAYTENDAARIWNTRAGNNDNKMRTVGFYFGPNGELMFAE